jgi:hypothetical protein
MNNTKNVLLAVILSLIIGCALHNSSEPLANFNTNYTYDGDINPSVFLSTWDCDRDRYQYIKGYYLFLFENPGIGKIRRIEALFIIYKGDLGMVGYKYMKDDIIYFFILNPETNHFDHIGSEPSETQTI